MKFLNKKAASFIGLVVITPLTFYPLISRHFVEKKREVDSLELTKQNLQKLKKALNQYAKDHTQHYPTCLREPEFSWSKYLPEGLAASPIKPLKNEWAIAGCSTTANVLSMAMNATAANQSGVESAVFYYVTPDKKQFAANGRYQKRSLFKLFSSSEFEMLKNEKGTNLVITSRDNL